MGNIEMFGPFSKMAAETNEGKGQFLFCSLCRLNHDQGRKHAYSRKHKTLLGKILVKFGKKVWEVGIADARYPVPWAICQSFQSRRDTNPSTSHANKRFRSVFF